MLRPQEIDDATQAVLERVLEHRHRFRGESAVRVWILGIARNVGLEVARARQRAPKLLEQPELHADDLLGADRPSQEEQLGRKEQHALALNALDGLSLDEKLVLLVTYVDELPGPEAAELLGVSFAAFRQRLSRARQALAARLQTLMDEGAPGSADVLAEWQKLFHPEADADPDESEGE